jgi:hypothetical protein
VRRLAVFLLVLLWLPAYAVTIGWDESDGASGYRLYYGTNSGVYGVTVDVGTNLTAKILGLIPGRTNYFVVTAYSSYGIESIPSAELVYAVPTVITNTILTVDHAGKITGPWTNVVAVTNIAEAAGFWRVNIKVSTNLP